VKWLHENRSEGCTAQAMDRAAGNGHFDVVRYLRANRSEGCSWFAFRLAAGANNLEIMRWLVYNYPQFHTRREMLSLRRPELKEFTKRWISDGCLSLD
jgi:hypothetical protein